MRFLILCLLLQPILGFLDIIPIQQSKTSSSVELHENVILMKEEMGKCFAGSDCNFMQVYNNYGGFVQNIGTIFHQNTKQIILTTDVVVTVGRKIDFYKKRSTKYTYDWELDPDHAGETLDAGEGVTCFSFEQCKILCETLVDDPDDDCFISVYNDGTFQATDDDDYYFSTSSNGVTWHRENKTSVAGSSFYNPNPNLFPPWDKVGSSTTTITTTTRISVVDAYTDDNGASQKFRLLVSEPNAASPKLVVNVPDLSITNGNSIAAFKGRKQELSLAGWGMKGIKDWLVVCTDKADANSVKRSAIQIHKWNGTNYIHQTVADINDFRAKFSTGSDQICKGGVEHNMDILIEKDSNNKDILHILLQDMEISNKKGGVHYIIYNSVDQSYTYKQTIIGQIANEQLGKQVHTSDLYGDLSEAYLLLSAPTHSGRNDGGWRLYQLNQQKLFEEVDSHINAYSSVPHEIGIDIDLSGTHLAISGNVDDLISTNMNYGTKVYSILQDRSGQQQCQNGQFFSGESCMPCMVLKTQYQNYKCCRMTRTSASRYDCEMNDVPCRLCSHLWKEWHHGTCNSCNATLGEFCEANQDCQSNDCRGGACCSPFLNDPNCAACGTNGFCQTCASNYAYNYTTNKCALVTTTAAGGACSTNSSCTSGYCLTNCCSNAQNYNGCSVCDSSGNCQTCQAGKTWTAGIGCQ